MIHKQPIKKANAFFKIFVYFELAVLFGSYLLWKRMNSSQEFRYKIKTTFPSMLEGYYKIGESIGNIQTREYDRIRWSSK
jgi:hypothetical protein